MKRGTKPIPLGYMYKRVATRPDWLAVPHVAGVYSVSGCISKDFMEHIETWKGNGYWFFDHPSIMVDLAREHGVDLSGCTLCYYEAIGGEFDEDSRTWHGFGPEKSLKTEVIQPDRLELQGFDVVCFSTGNAAECSPLSCNSLASEIPVNSHCLLETSEAAKDAIESGRFDHSEPGPFRIIAVYVVPETAGSY